MAISKSIKSTQLKTRELMFRVQGTGTAAIQEGSFDGVLVDNGTGDYTITFTESFGRAPIVAVGVLTSNAIHQISSVSTTAVRVKGFAASDGTTAKDIDFHLIICGSDVADQI